MAPSPSTICLKRDVWGRPAQMCKAIALVWTIGVTGPRVTPVKAIIEATRETIESPKSTTIPKSCSGYPLPEHRMPLKTTATVSLTDSMEGRNRDKQGPEDCQRSVKIKQQRTLTNRQRPAISAASSLLRIVGAAMLLTQQRTCRIFEH